MRNWKFLLCRGCRTDLALSSCSRAVRPIGAAAGFFVGITALAAFAQNGQPRSASHMAAVAQANSLPDPIEVMEIQDQNAAGQRVETLDAARHKLLTDESAELLRLALDLKQTMDKTGKDTLSLDVIRKADEIEKLAKGVKQNMRLTVGR